MARFELGSLVSAHVLTPQVLREAQHHRYEPLGARDVVPEVVRPVVACTAGLGWVGLG